MALDAYVALVVTVLVVIVFVKVGRRRRVSATPVRRRGFGVGAGATGAIYDLLNDDRRKAVEIIVEEKAGYRDPEDADGNLPDLEEPDRRPRGRR